MRAWNRSLSNVGMNCKNCTERYPGCHDRCERYQSAVKERNAQRQKLKKMAAVENEYIAYKSQRRGQI